jgi:hypothetical protein
MARRTRRSRSRPWPRHATSAPRRSRWRKRACTSAASDPGSSGSGCRPSLGSRARNHRASARKSGPRFGLVQQTPISWATSGSSRHEAGTSSSHIAPQVSRLISAAPTPPIAWHLERPPADRSASRPLVFHRSPGGLHSPLALCHHLSAPGKILYVKPPGNHKHTGGSQAVNQPEWTPVGWHEATSHARARSLSARQRPSPNRACSDTEPTPSGY